MRQRGVAFLLEAAAGLVAAGGEQKAGEEQRARVHGARREGQQERMRCALCSRASGWGHCLSCGGYPEGLTGRSNGRETLGATALAVKILGLVLPEIWAGAVTWREHHMLKAQ